MRTLTSPARLTARPHLSPPQTFCARVLARTDDAFRLQGPRGETLAKRAPSCLVEPCTDDLVLALHCEEGRCFLLAVLERRPDRPLQLQLDPGVQLTAGGGALQLKAANGLRLESEQQLELTGRQLNLVAERGSLLIRSLSVLSRWLHLDTDHAALVAGAVEAVTERVSSHAKRVSRHIAELEQVQAAEYQLRVDDNLLLRARNAVVRAQRLVKLDGEQVHVG